MTNTGRRLRRSAEAARRLERMRARNAEQLAAQREAEKRIDAALVSYVDAAARILAIEQAGEQKITVLCAQIDKIREQRYP